MPQHGVFIVRFVVVGWEWRLFREMGRERARGTVQGGQCREVCGSGDQATEWVC